jgi:hypothetical protein
MALPVSAACLKFLYHLPQSFQGLQTKAATGTGAVVRKFSSFLPRVCEISQGKHGNVPRTADSKERHGQSPSRP